MHTKYSIATPVWAYMMYERTLSILRARMVFNLHTISYVYVRTTTLEYDGKKPA